MYEQIAMSIRGVFWAGFIIGTINTAVLVAVGVLAWWVLS